MMQRLSNKCISEEQQSINQYSSLKYHIFKYIIEVYNEEENYFRHNDYRSNKYWIEWFYYNYPIKCHIFNSKYFRKGKKERRKIVPH